MLVYHGSYTQIANPDIGYGRYNLDFGRGFYVTTLREQAEKWAKRKAIVANDRPIINIYEFNTDQLAILSFEGYNSDWLDFVVANRTRTALPHSYDAIYGNIADDDVAATVDEYLRLLSMNRVNDDVKRATLFQLTFSKPNNQYCVSTQRGIEALSFLRGEALEV
jgi:hypothetical protein